MTAKKRLGDLLGIEPPREGLSPEILDEFEELERIRKQVSLTRNERPMTESFFKTKAQEPMRQRLLLKELLNEIQRSHSLVSISSGESERTRRTRVKAELERLVETLSSRKKISLSSRETDSLVSDAMDEIVGLGPIEQLMRDPEVSEIMVNGPDFVFAERRGRIELTPIRFLSREHLSHTIEKILAPIGRKADEASPMVDGRSANGSRVNVVMPPVALEGPFLTIRKFFERMLTADDLLDFNSISEAMVDYLRKAVRAKMNIIVSGGTGSGKTTLLNILSSFIPHNERIVVVEDASELQVHRYVKNVCRMEARPPNIEGKGEIRIRDLVRNALRMRPDRIVVGEVRGAEALDMLQAMNTGHDGSLTTAHSNSATDLLSRIEGMVLMSGLDLPVSTVREMVSNAIHMVVQISRLRDGSRRVTQIAEVEGIIDGRIVLRPLFAFQSRGTDDEGRIFGAYRWSGLTPFYLSRFEDEGIEPPVLAAAEREA